FVTCLAWPDVSLSDSFVARALETRGAHVTGLPWNKEGARFDGFDAVVLRSSWDYHHAPDAYLAWLARWEAAGVAIWNTPALIRWNLSKAYLLDLEGAGLPVVPTLILDDEAARLPVIMAERGWDVGVVKPVVSASAHDTTLVPAAQADAVARAIGEGRDPPAGVLAALRRGVPTPVRWAPDLHPRPPHPRVAQASGGRRLPGAAGFGRPLDAGRARRGSGRGGPAGARRAPRATALRPYRRRGDRARIHDHGGGSARARTVLQPGARGGGR